MSPLVKKHEVTNKKASIVTVVKKSLKLYIIMNQSSLIKVWKSANLRAAHRLRTPAYLQILSCPRNRYGKEKASRNFRIFQSSIFLLILPLFGWSPATGFLSHIPPAPASSSSLPNSIFLSHHSSSSLQLQPAEHGVFQWSGKVYFILSLFYLHIILGLF